MKSVLILEDDEDTRDLFLEVLSTYEVNLKAVVTLKEALALLARIPFPDLILSDLSVSDSKEPDEIVEALQKAAPKSRLVLVSGNDSVSTVAAKHGIEYVKKPVNFNELLNLLD